MGDSDFILAMSKADPFVTRAMIQAAAARFAGWLSHVHISWGSAALHPRLYAVTRSAGYFVLGAALFLNLSIIGGAQPTARQAKSTVTFEEISPKQSGITWTHNNAHSSERHLPETVGAGCAFFDYDNDGWMDIYLVNSGPSDFFKPKTPLRNALYRNNHDGTFTDVTDKAGVAGGIFGMGVAAADYDNDGWVDLYVTGYGRNLLYRNNGNATFTDVTEKTGTAVQGWSTCAVWFDYDNDGKLDLFVSSFAYYDKTLNILCSDDIKRTYYCIPRHYKPRPSYLFKTVVTALLLM